MVDEYDNGDVGSDNDEKGNDVRVCDSDGGGVEMIMVKK